MLVLSHSDTHTLNRHMVGCGCHEILIPCSTTVLFSTPFLLISISRIEGEDEGKFTSNVRRSTHLTLDCGGQKPFFARTIVGKIELATLSE